MTKEENLRLPLASDSFHAKYILSHKLGKGAFAWVYAARRAGDGVDVAVKILDLWQTGGAAPWKPSAAGALDGKRYEDTCREVALLRRVSGLQNVIGHVDTFIEEGLAYIVMEKCELALVQALEQTPSLTESTLRSILRAMLKAIAAVHSANVVHLDIKPDNFMFVGPDVGAPPGQGLRLCDFGLAAQSLGQREILRGVHGTPPFMAPEMLRSVPYGPKVDVWSLGAVAHLLLCGEFPYRGKEHTSASMKAAILRGEPVPSCRPSPGVHPAGSACLSSVATEWLRTMLCRQPWARPSAEAALRLPFFAISQVTSEVSLRPILFAAKRIGAFDRRRTEWEKTELDSTLANLQIRHNSPVSEQPEMEVSKPWSLFQRLSPAPTGACKPDRSPASDDTTQAGGSICSELSFHLGSPTARSPM